MIVHHNSQENMYMGDRLIIIIIMIRTKAVMFFL